MLDVADADCAVVEVVVAVSVVAWVPVSVSSGWLTGRKLEDENPKLVAELVDDAAVVESEDAAAVAESDDAAAVSADTTDAIRAAVPVVEAVDADVASVVVDEAAGVAASSDEVDEGDVVTFDDAAATSDDAGVFAAADSLNADKADVESVSAVD